MDRKTVATKSGELSYLEAGDQGRPPIVLLHGWPDSADVYRKSLPLLGQAFRAIAFDLPGIGGSTARASSGAKRDIAAIIAEAARALGIERAFFAGFDVGGMTTYALLRSEPDLVARAAIGAVAIPGIDPWARIISAPYAWHFQFHKVPDLPEALVEGRQRRYFDYFYGLLAHTQSAVDADARATYAAAYAGREALKTGFDWYRAFEQDAKDNAASAGPLSTPLLYLRGGAERVNIDDYLKGFQAAGLADVTPGIIPDSGHFLPEERPEAFAKALIDFAR